MEEISAFYCIKISTLKILGGRKKLLSLPGFLYLLCVQNAKLTELGLKRPFAQYIYS